MRVDGIGNGDTTAVFAAHGVVCDPGVKTRSKALQWGAELKLTIGCNSRYWSGNTLLTLHSAAEVLSATLAALSKPSCDDHQHCYACTAVSGALL